LGTIEHFCPYKPTSPDRYSRLFFLVTSISLEATTPYYNDGLAAETETKTKTIDFGGALFKPASPVTTLH
jgi:hypothetical protein